MPNVNFPSPNPPKPHLPASPAPPPQSEKTAADAPSLRKTAGAQAPASLALSPAPAAPAMGPHFEKLSGPVPEIPGLSEYAAFANADAHPPGQILAQLKRDRDYFASLLEKGMQTKNSLFTRDGTRTHNLINPILNAENARTPGLNAMGFTSEEKMAQFLRDLSTPERKGQEGHVRCHVGVDSDYHRVAVDAFKHRGGGFTLIAVDSGARNFVKNRFMELENKNPDIIKGVFLINTFNQVHQEGCRIFAVHTLNAMHDYQPHIQKLHRMVYKRSRDLPAPRGSGSAANPADGNSLVLADESEAFSLLPGKFFKHMQVMKPKPDNPFTLLDDAESRNPALKHEALNKKGQTLRQRFASQNPDIAPEKFSRADRTASLDRKRLVLIDRAIAYYEKRRIAQGNATPDARSFWLENSWI